MASRAKRASTAPAVIQKAPDEATQDLERAAARIRTIADRLISFNTMDIRQLAALYDCFWHVNDSLVAFLNAPRFEGESSGTFNEAGDFLEEFKEATAWIVQAALYQLRSRTPTEDEFGIYSEALVDWHCRCEAGDLSSLLAVASQLMDKKRQQGK